MSRAIFWMSNPTRVCIDAVVAIPSGPSVLDLLYPLLYRFNQPTCHNRKCDWMGDVTWDGKNIWKIQERLNTWIFLLVKLLFHSIVLAFLLLFLFPCWYCTLGQRDTVLLLASSVKALSVVKVKRRNGRRRDLITPLIYSVASSWVWL